MVPVIVPTKESPSKLLVGASLTTAPKRRTTIRSVTFDDSAWAQAIPGGLTVISRPVEELATLALEILVNEISDSGTPHKQIVLPCSIEVRGSVSDLTSA